jgi:hypothetical protein
MHALLSTKQEKPMAKYTGDVIASTNDDFPFMAIVTEESGTVVSECPVRTEADGEAKIMEMLRELKEHEPQVNAGGK